MIWLNHTPRPASPSGSETRTSTFNPKVAGAIPARPILNRAENLMV